MISPNANRKRNTVVGLILVLLSLLASLFGLFGHVYRDSDWAASQLKGQDAATILVVLGLLFLTVFWSILGIIGLGLSILYLRAVQFNSA